MLELVDLTVKTEKEQYKSEIALYKKQLILLEQEIKEKGLPVIILFEGFGASGKGSMISKTISCLDPRSFMVYSTAKATAAEKRMPLMHRFWKIIPEKGRMTILDRSWYQETARAFLEDGISEKEYIHRLDGVNLFERQLTDDGYLIIKFFLTIDKHEQKKRFEKLMDSKVTEWRVNELDLKRNKKYDKYYEEYDGMLNYTNTEHAPWNVIPSNDKRTAVLAVYKALCKSIRAALDGSKDISATAKGRTVEMKQFKLLKMPKLNEIDLSPCLTDEEYDKLLEQEQKKLSKLHSKLYARKIPVVIAFEGWDAAGKGGNIRRISAALDPRGYEAVPVAAPDKHELNRHYLWRFWNKLPKTGHIAIFDRTWYGRVMVERLEGFTPESRWSMAYQEMNEFEDELTCSGAVVLKFWLQIDKDEQLKRFTERQNTPEKQWKITNEDWRNREKWDKYEIAVNEMIEKTSTDFAPWHIIPANDKKYARIATLKIINEALEKRMGK
ncbi:MAG: polyphosphate:AMP phosphotransferase [Ruminiclostridium sp.]